MISNDWKIKKNQGKILLDPNRFGVVVAGRRFAKTTTLLHKLNRWAWSAPEYNGGVWGYFAPTYRQAKLIAWDIMKRIAIPPYLIRGRPNESDLSVTLKNHHTIRLFGVDKPQHLFGVKLLGGIGDEYDQWKDGVYDTYLRPALSDTEGPFWFAGNPDATKRKLKDLYDSVAIKLAENSKASWSRYHYRSIDGGYIPVQEIEEAKGELDERTFKEQYEASFLELLGQIYYGFGDANICAVDPFGIPVEYNPRLPIRLCWDFNVSPFCVSACHHIPHDDVGAMGDKYTYVDIHTFQEFAIRNSNTEEMCKTILEKYKNHRSGIVIYGDAAGNSRHTSASFSDYQIIIDHFKNMPGFQMKVKSANPSVKDRINAVNSKLKAYDGRRHWFVHPRNKKLIRDFLNVKFKEGTTEIDKTDLELTHMSDGVGYMADMEFPVIRSYIR